MILTSENSVRAISMGKRNKIKQIIEYTDAYRNSACLYWWESKKEFLDSDGTAHGDPVSDLQYLSLNNKEFPIIIIMNTGYHYRYGVVFDDYTFEVSPLFSGNDSVKLWSSDEEGLYEFLRMGGKIQDWITLIKL